MARYGRNPGGVKEWMGEVGETKRMNVLILKHVDIEGPGIDRGLPNKREEIPYQILNLESNPPLSQTG